MSGVLREYLVCGNSAEISMIFPPFLQERAKEAKGEYRSIEEKFAKLEKERDDLQRR